MTKRNAGQRCTGAPPGVPSLSRGTPHSRVANGRPHSAQEADRSTQPSWRWRHLTVPFDVGADHRARITILSFVCSAHDLGGQGASGPSDSIPQEKFRGFRPIELTPPYVFIRTPLNRVKFHLDIFSTFPSDVNYILSLIIFLFLSLFVFPGFFLNSYYCSLLKFSTFDRDTCFKQFI